MSSELGRSRSGAFVFVVGPSGAGKDTLISGAQAKLAHDDRFHFVKRSVTRPLSRWEDHESFSLEAFVEAERRGAFALTWEAHGLRYGVPAEALDHVRDGRIVICNGSRGAISAAMQTCDRLKIVLVTAPREVRMSRLTQRRREEDINHRLDRLGGEEFTQIADIVIMNDGTPDAGTTKLLSFLEKIAGRLEGASGS